jgi:hypothetical protein
MQASGLREVEHMSGGKIKNGVAMLIASASAVAAHGGLSAPLVLQNFAQVSPISTLSTQANQFQSGDLIFGSAGYALGGTTFTGGEWSASMSVFSDTNASVQGASGTNWGFTARNSAETAGGSLRISSSADWSLGDSGGTLTGGAKAGLLYDAGGAFLPLQQFSGVALQGSGSSGMGVLFTLVLAQVTGAGQASAFTQVLVPAGQSVGNIRLDFSSLSYVPDADGYDLTLDSIQFLGIEITYLFSVGESDPALGSASGTYDLSQVVLVPGPSAAVILAAWTLTSVRRRVR